MFPIALDLKKLRIALIGGGEAALKRLHLLDDAGGTEDLTIFAEDASEAFHALAGTRLHARLPDDEELASFQLVMIVDVEDELAFAMAHKVRAAGHLVNVEDRRAYCDFHFQSLVRRGDLLLTVGTNGGSPALTVRIRKYLEEAFPPIWETRLQELKQLRHNWKQQGCTIPELIKRGNQYINQQGWFKT